jgi:hypothetical protein
MQGETWQDYGTMGSQALEHEEIELAIVRLERLWEDAQAHAHEVEVDGGLYALERCACCQQQAS